MVHNSWTDDPLEDRKISMEPSWQGQPSNDKILWVEIIGIDVEG